MAHLRFLTTVVSLSAAGTILLAGPTLTGERDAGAAARAAPKTTAARTTRARRSNESPSSGRTNQTNQPPSARAAGDAPSARAADAPSARATGDAPSARAAGDTPSARAAGDTPKDGVAALTKDAPSRERDAPRDKSATRAARETQLAQTGSEKTAAKSHQDGVSNTKFASPDTRTTVASELVKPTLDIAQGRSADVGSGRISDTAPARGTDPHIGAAKAPTEVASNAKSATEKSTNEASAADTGETPRSAFDAAQAARRELGSVSSATAAARPVLVALEGPVFDGGDVPRAAAALDRMKAGFARCASVENALTKSEASIDLRFLVRAPGRAEGVGVDKARGVSSDVVRCMTSVLARSYVGAPSDDPVGVAVTVRVRRTEASNN